MAGEIVETIEPAIALLGMGLGAAVAANALRLNPIVGYLVLGAGLAALGYADRFEGPVVATLAEVGVMFLLFNLGLHFSVSRIREEAANIFGFGSLQMLVAGGGYTAILLLLGLPTAGAVIGGFALGLSSTAVVIGLVRQRDQEDCPVGRAAQSILIFQDIAAIMLLVAVGALGAGGALGPALGLAGLKAIAAFVLAVLFARFLTEPLFRTAARVRSSEVYTAMALFIALAAGWAAGIAGLSLTLGAFLGGVAVADSRYRILVQTEIEAFRGLFLGFFFISVGLGIDPQVLADNWLLIMGVALGLIVTKCVFNVIAGLANRWSVPGSIQLAFLLGQGSEFALLLLAMPGLAGLLGAQVSAVLITAIAISLALTPMVSLAGRVLAGKLRQGPPDQKLAGDDAPVVLLNLGETGRTIADRLAEEDVDYLAIDGNMERFEKALADGYPVHHAMLTDPRSWDAVSMAKRQVLVITEVDPDTMRELGPLVDDRLPGVTRIAATETRDRHAEIEGTGAFALATNTPSGHDDVIHRVLRELGLEPDRKEGTAGARAAA
ncbi:cation:proton antiporter [Erythrobacteraceae bacterium WH01K]|nr:cation:proton antiporter [Erythrobacteraceae bacterium WH01K]